MQSGSGSEQKKSLARFVPEESNYKLPKFEAWIASLSPGDGMVIEKRLSDYVLFAIALHLQTQRKLYLHLDVTIRQLDILLKNMGQPDICLTPFPHGLLKKSDHQQHLANLKHLVRMMRQDGTLCLDALTLEQIKVCMENLKPGVRVILSCPSHPDPKREAYFAKATYIVTHMPEGGIFEFSSDTHLNDIKALIQLASKGAAGIITNPVVQIVTKASSQPEMKITKAKAKRKAKVLDESTKNQEEKKEAESDAHKKPKASSSNLERLRKIRDPLINAVVGGDLKTAEQYYAEFMSKVRLQKSPLLTLRSFWMHQSKDKGYKFLLILVIEGGYLAFAQTMVDDLIKYNSFEASRVYEKILSCNSERSESIKKVFTITPEMRNKLDNLFRKVLVAEVLASSSSVDASSISSRSPATDYSQVSSPRSISSTSILSSSSFSSVPTALQEHSLFGGGALSLGNDDDELTLDDPIGPGMQAPYQFSTSENLPPLQTPVSSYSIEDGMMDLRYSNDEPSLLDDPFDKFGLSRGGFSS